ncbi:MAG: ureidoglycolate lyase [Halioglobus sp.]
MVIELALQPLTSQAFSPFGDVIEVCDDNEQLDINYGRTVRHHALATADVTAQEGAAIMSIFSSQPIVQPFPIRVMERHLLGSQAFIPLSGRPYAILVAPAGEFDQNKLCAFLATAEQGVNYHRGTWHHYCMALEAESNFLVVDRQGPGDNCDEIELSGELCLNLPS